MALGAIMTISSHTSFSANSLERELGQAGVLVVADPVLDVRVLAVATLEHGDVVVGLDGEDRLEAVPVVVGDAQLRAGVRTLTPHDHAGSFRPCGWDDHVGDLTDLAVVAARAVLVKRRTPGISGICTIAARAGSVSS
jgi:hypothetical protein